MTETYCKIVQLEKNKENPIVISSNALEMNGSNSTKMLSARNSVIIPFRYPGGKFYALKYILPFCQCIEHDEYREPFAGGASVFFAKTKVKNNWINDIDEALIITYKVMSDEFLRNKLNEVLRIESASKERWSQIRNFKPRNEFEQAYKYFYMNRTSFSGKLISPAYGFRPKRSVPPERWHEKILPCGKKLENVKITSDDFEKVITQPAKGRKVLLFVDPPYFLPPKRKHYRNGFSRDDHLRLSGLLRKTKHKFILTYEDTPEVRNLYDWANIHPVNFTYRVDNSKIQNGKRFQGRELIITNFKMPEQKMLGCCD